MSKLTKAQVRALESVLYHAKRADRYLNLADTAVCLRASVASTTLHYSRADGQALYEVQKEYGSDLCGMSDAIRILEQFLADDLIAKSKA